MASESDQPVVTPQSEGPPADPVLLAANGAANTRADAEQAGMAITLNTLQKFQRELSKIPEETEPLIQSVLKQLNDNNITTSSEKQQQLRELSTTLSDVSDTALPVRSLTETFVLSNILLITFGISSTLGSYVLSPLVGLFVPSVGAALISGIALPIAAGIEMRKDQRPLDALRSLLIVSGVQGLLTGASISRLSLTGEPFTILSPLVSAFALAAVSLNNRQTALATIGASSIGAHLLVGLIERQLSLPYFLLTLLYTASVVVPTQLSARDAKVNINVYSVITVGITVASKLLVYGLLGASAAAASHAAVVQQSAPAAA